MRKLIVMGLFALSFGSFGSPAFAGNVEDCEVLKDGQTPGLYGLCIAWHNAGSDNARDRILDRYEEKAGPGDPPLPGAETGIPCPCWDDIHLATASADGVPFSCRITGTDTGVEFTNYEKNSNVQAYTFFVQDGFCFRVDPVSSTIAGLTEPGTEASCREDIRILIEMDFGGACD